MSRSSRVRGRAIHWMFRKEAYYEHKLLPDPIPVSQDGET